MYAHELKIKEEYFEDVIKKRKRFEIRRDDREPRFEIDDVLILVEIKEEGLTGETYYTGRICAVTVEYVLRDFEGLAPGYCALGIKK